MREFEEKSISIETIGEHRKFVDQSYISGMRNTVNDFIDSLEEFKDYPEFREIFRDFISDELKNMKPEDYSVIQKIKTWEKTKSDHIRTHHRIMRLNKKMLSSAILLIEILKTSNDKLIDAYENFIPEKSGNKDQLGRGETAFNAYITFFDREGRKPSYPELAREANSKILKGSKPFGETKVYQNFKGFVISKQNKGLFTPEFVKKYQLLINKDKSQMENSDNSDEKLVINEVEIKNNDKKEIKSDKSESTGYNKPEKYT